MLMTREGSLMRLQLRYWLGLQSTEGLPGTGGSVCKVTHMALGRRPQFFVTWISLKGCLSILFGKIKDCFEQGIVYSGFFQNTWSKREGKEEPLMPLMI